MATIPAPNPRHHLPNGQVALGGRSPENVRSCLFQPPEAVMAHTAHSDHFASFAEFYPYYLSEHRNIGSRRLHFIGSLGVIGCLAMALATGDWLWLPAAVICGYGFAWVGHFFFEKNKPATFRHPFYSLMGDWVMFKDICVGKISL
jgi:hypothetical protein